VSLKGEVVEYIHLPAGADVPEIAARPRRLLVIAEQAVATDWMDAVSDWIVKSGCLFMMAWGADCEAWHDSVDHAYLAHHDFGEVADEHFLMTTWHDDEPLNEVFWFAAACASHSTIELPVITLLHIAPEPRRGEILAQYEAERAAADDGEDSGDGDALPASHQV
jgi:hypothetical protein